MEPISVIFASLNFAKSIAAYLGIVDTIDAKIDKLSKSEYHAGVSALEQAINSVSERTFLLREARSYFNKATGLEKDERLVLAYLGLATCHYHLNDRCNCENALRKALDVEADGKTKAVIGTAIETAMLPSIHIIKNLFYPTHQPSISMKLYERKVQKINDLQLQIKQYIDNKN